MLKKAFICMALLGVVFGCSNQQKETIEETQPAEICG